MISFLKATSYMKINFEGGDLNSDAGLCFGLTIQSPSGSTSILKICYRWSTRSLRRILKITVPMNLLSIPYSQPSLKKKPLPRNRLFPGFSIIMDESTLEQFGMFEGRCGISYMPLCHRNTWFLTSIQPCSIPTADRRVKPSIAITRHTVIIPCCVLTELPATFWKQNCGMELNIAASIRLCSIIAGIPDKVSLPCSVPAQR